MSLTLSASEKPLIGFPRVSGDEPKAPKGTHTVTLFSPRERG